MSEEIKPVAAEQPADVEKVEQEVPAAAPVAEEPVAAEPVVVEEPVAEPAPVNFAEKTLAQLSELFQNLTASEDRMKRFKEAEAIKSAFYKRLSKEKAEAGEDAAVDEPDENSSVEEVTVPLQSGPVSP